MSVISFFLISIYIFLVFKKRKRLAKQRQEEQEATEDDAEGDAVDIANGDSLDQEHSQPVKKITKMGSHSMFVKKRTLDQIVEEEKQNDISSDSS